MTHAGVVFDRAPVARRGVVLTWINLVYNAIEAVISLAAGVVAGSVSLIGFGIDSTIELSSSVMALWRLQVDSDVDRRARAERVGLRLIGASFLALAAFVTYEAGEALWRREVPDESPVGIAIAACSALCMPLLARAKRRVAEQLGSGTLAADARQTDFCAYLSVILLVGLALNALFGWWWADPVAALAMVPIIAREGADGIRGRSHCGCAHAH
ncbi:MAG: cation transporter [Gemmatimonadaceae bacterium]|jgi:divalent metal cation (Fe/Co/Zn/Cd) transporter|nr:cation transporter [Gemmatimonadaceae bacterium]